MNIRLANQKDKQQILKLMDEFSCSLHSPDIPSKIGGKIYDEIISRKDTKIFIAEQNSKIVGLVTFYLLPNLRHGWHRGHIEDFFTSESERGKGIGTKLFDAIKKYCQQNNIKVIKLGSGVELTNAHQFYEKNGGKFTEKIFRFDLK